MRTLPMIHLSPETAHVIPDYPYGFVLRCQKRVWIEYKPTHGYRVVEQTSNPKRPGLVWNKPKAGIYHLLLVLTLDENEHIGIDALSAYNASDASDAEVDAFAALHAAALDAPREQVALGYLRALARALEKRREARELVITSSDPIRVI